MIEDPIRSAFEQIDQDAPDEFRDHLLARLLAELLADDATGDVVDGVALTSIESRRGGRAAVLLAVAATVIAIGLAAITLVNRQQSGDTIDTGTVPASEIDETTPTTTATNITTSPTTVPTNVTTAPTSVPATPPPATTEPLVTSTFGTRPVSAVATSGDIVPFDGRLTGWIFSADGQVLYNAPGTEAIMPMPEWGMRLYDPVTLTFERELACPTAPGSDTRMPVWNDEIAATWDDRARAALTALSARAFGLSWRCPVAFSADGSRAAQHAFVHGGPQTVLWDAADGAELKTLQGSFPAFSPDGRLLAVWSSPGVIRVHDAATGEPIGEVEPEHPGTQTPEVKARFTPDGTRLVTIGSSIEVWDVQSLTRLSVISSPDFFYDMGVSFSSDSTRITAGLLESHAAVWDLTTGEELLRFDDVGESTQVVPSAEFTPDDTMIITTVNEDGRNEPHAHDARTGDEIAWPSEPNAVNGEVVNAVFSPDGRSITIVTVGGSLGDPERPYQLQRWVFDAS